MVNHEIRVFRQTLSVVLQFLPQEKIAYRNNHGYRDKARYCQGARVGEKRRSPVYQPGNGENARQQPHNCTNYKITETDMGRAGYNVDQGEWRNGQQVHNEG